MLTLWQSTSGHWLDESGREWTDDAVRRMARAGKLTIEHTTCPETGCQQAVARKAGGKEGRAATSEEDRC